MDTSGGLGLRKNIIITCLLRDHTMDSTIDYKRNLSKAEKEDIKGMERKLKRGLEIIYGEGNQRKGEKEKE